VLFLGIIPLDELCFYGRDYEISPRPRRKNPAKKKKSGVFAA
jgi:hypothetical protein